MSGSTSAPTAYEGEVVTVCTPTSDEINSDRGARILERRNGLFLPAS